MPSILTFQFLRSYRLGSCSASLMSVYSRNKCPHLPKPTPTSRMDCGLSWRTRLITVGIVLGRLLGMSSFTLTRGSYGTQSKHDQPFVLQHTVTAAQVLAETGIVLKPPEGGPGKSDIGGPALL